MKLIGKALACSKGDLSSRCVVSMCVFQLKPSNHRFLFVQQEYFDGDEVDHSSEPPSAKGLAVFRDPNAVNGIKRTATSINWHPDGPTKIAVSYRFVSFMVTTTFACEL